MFHRSSFSSAAGIALAGLAAIAVPACGNSSGSDVKADPPAAPAKPLDVAAVNALVPAALKDKVSFEKTEIVEERGRSRKTVYTVAAPKGWKQGMKGFASLKPEG